MQFTSTLIAAFFAAAVSAQSNSTAAGLAAQIPACAAACDDAAIAQVGCAPTDYACHCAHGTQLAGIILPCLGNSTCSAADKATFGAIVPKICAALNSTASASSAASSSAAGSSTAAGSATAIPSGPTSTGSSPSATSSKAAAMMNAASTLLTVGAVGAMGFFFGGF